MSNSIFTKSVNWMLWLVYRVKYTYWMNRITRLSILTSWSYSIDSKEFFLDQSYDSAKDNVIEDLSYWD